MLSTNRVWSRKKKKKSIVAFDMFLLLSLKSLHGKLEQDNHLHRNELGKAETINQSQFFFKEFSECGPHLLGRVPVVYILFIVPFLVFIPQSIVLGFCWESKSVITSPLCVSQN